MWTEAYDDRVERDEGRERGRESAAEVTEEAALEAQGNVRDLSAARHRRDAARRLERAAEVIKRVDPIERWAKSTRDEVAAEAFQRDEAFLGKLLPLMELLGSYFGAEVEGLEDLPADQPLLLVGNHSGGTLTPDTTALLAAWYRVRGLADPLVTLGLDAAFAVPGFGTIMRKIGAVPASHGNAAAAFASGASVLVYPGGAHEVFRPWADRNRIDFDGRKGFVKLALRNGVPVVPVVGHGGHETTVVLARGEAIARAFRMDRLRVSVYPILLQFPWGVSTPAFPGVPLPAKVRVRVLPPLDWSRFGPEDADDPAVLEECYQEVVARMQETLDVMARENPRPLWSRVAGLFRR